ncbi:MAG: sigma-70 family RNA polymerase sigma factor [Cyanobacteriota bacterium]
MAPSQQPDRISRSPRPSSPIPRRQAPADRSSLTRRNRRWLEAYSSSTDPASRLQWRNRLVEANLGLVHSQAARFRGISHLPHGDLVQVGCQGLIRAVEAFDPRRARCLSTFAVPYVRGAMQHEIRDREAWIRPPRPLWDLHQRAWRLVERRRVAGLPPPGRQELATALNCSLQELDAAWVLRSVAIPLSLDAARSNALEGEGESTWLERLADPLSLPREAPPPPDPGHLAQHSWLRRQLASMEPLRRDLVLGRVLLDCTWVELGQRLGIHPRMAERRCNATLRQLRLQADSWRQGEDPALELSAG